ncbi:MAG: response regulator, partial [Verrucomicrobiota bacterium]
MRLLFVEDSRRLRETVALALRRTGYRVDAVENGDEGFELAELHDYDAAILDIMVPGMDGLRILQELRQRGNEVPVLFLTAKDTVEDRVHGLRSGADDYLVKPFALDELLARIEVLCRRSYQKASPTLEIADLYLDTAAKVAKRGEQVLDLTARE